MPASRFVICRRAGPPGPPSAAICISQHQRSDINGVIPRNPAGSEPARSRCAQETCASSLGWLSSAGRAYFDDPPFLKEAPRRADVLAKPISCVAMTLVAGGGQFHDHVEHRGNQFGFVERRCHLVEPE